MTINASDLERLRELAARVGCLVQEDYCALAGITESTEISHRKRGLAPPYVVHGTRVLYPVDTLASYLKTKIRDRTDTGAGAGL